MTDWVQELLQVWADSDQAQVRRELGYRTSAAWRDAGPGDEQADVGGYSALEVRALAAAVDWLREAHPAHWRAVSRRYRPWTRATLPGGDEDAALVREALALLGARVDRDLG